MNSVAHDDDAAHASTTPLDRLADRLELEIGRLRDKRPDLSARIDRATSLLVTHLACPRAGMIRVRIDARGSTLFLVSSVTRRGAVYVIDPASWSCTCPAAHRYPGPCKHILCCWTLVRVAQPRVRKQTCCGCDQRFPRREMVELRENNHDGLTYFNGQHLCPTCAGRAGVER